MIYQEPYAQAPLFERMNHEDQAQLEQCQYQITKLEQHCVKLERINQDLESRLERQAKDRLEVDREMGERIQAWERRLAEVVEERDEWRARTEGEQRHSEILQEKLRRTEKELHRILQKKYDIVRTAKLEERTAIKEREQISRGLQRMGEALGNGTQPHNGSLYGAMQGNVNSNPQGAGAVAVREKRVVDSLCDFFGL